MKNINSYSSKNMRYAAALGYRPTQDSAPRLMAKGRGIVAQKILDAATGNDIPIIHNSELLGLLMGLDIEQTIPEAAFGVVAEIYSFLLKMDERYAQTLD